MWAEIKNVWNYALFSLLFLFIITIVFVILAINPSVGIQKTSFAAFLIAEPYQHLQYLFLSFQTQY